MKTSPELDRLLEDVLAGDDSAVAARDVVWRHTVRQVRRRRRLRRAGRGALALAGAAVMGFVWWSRSVPPPAGPRETVRSGAVRIVHTVPLAPELVVATRPSAMPVVGTRTGAVAMVETNPGLRAWEEINDQQLLALLGDHAAMIVRRENGDAELIFVHPEDKRGFLPP